MLETTTSTALKQKLLIIEDEGEMCLLINLLLDDEELEIEHVKSLSAAVEYFQQQSPSVVLMDNRLPDGYGIDFISYIKNRYPGTKVIMISGMDAAARDVAIENGADLFLEKPFTRSQLCRAIQLVTHWHKTV
jgi:DNA-binding response OmpR family regulator